MVALEFGEQIGRCGGPGESPGGRCLGTAPLLRTPNGGGACYEARAGPQLNCPGGQYTLALETPSPASTRSHAGSGKRDERMRRKNKVAATPRSSLKSFRRHPPLPPFSSSWVPRSGMCDCFENDRLGLDGISDQVGDDGVGVRARGQERAPTTRSSRANTLRFEAQSITDRSSPFSSS